MKWGHPARGKVVLFAGDAGLVLLAVFLGALVRLGEPVNVLRVYTGATLVFTFTFLSLLYIFDLYNLAYLHNRRKTLAHLVLACGAGMFVSSASFYFLPPYRYGRGVFLLAVVLVGGLTFTWRQLFFRTSGRFLGKLPTVVLGTGASADILRQLLELNHTHYQLVGSVLCLTDRPEAARTAAQQLDQLIRPGSPEENHRVGCVVVASDSLPPELGSTLTRLKFEGVSVVPITDFYLRVAEELPLDFLNDSWLWFAEGFDLLQARLVRKVKRLADLMLAGVALLVTLPLMLLAVLAIKLESPGPVLLRQRRVGWLERPFELVKFRSMRADAETDDRARWADTDDPRVTRLGGWMRKLHIDEIPQMINVLRGEMSFIGPRPERPEFVEKLKADIPFYHLRHYVPPGITGWAQVHYPYGASVEDARRKLQYDLYYILNGSPLLDLRILLKTVQVVLFQRGSR